MAADLKLLSAFQRISVVIADESLITLEHGMTQDRMKKLLLNRVESVVIWRTFPWGRILLMALLLGGTGAGLLTIGDPLATGWAIAFLAVFAFVEFRYFYCRSTHIRIRREREDKDYVTLSRPGKVQRFIEKLQANIKRIQTRDARKADEKSRERDSRAMAAANMESVPEGAPESSPEDLPIAEPLPEPSPPADPPVDPYGPTT